MSSARNKRTLPLSSARPRSQRKIDAEVTNRIETLEKLQQRASECILCLTHLLSDGDDARQSLDWLESNPSARNLVMGVDAEQAPHFSTLDVINSHIGPHAQDGLLPKLTLASDCLPRPLVFEQLFDPLAKPTNYNTLLYVRIKFFANSVLKVIWKNYPILSCGGTFFPGHGAIAFSKALLGDDSKLASNHVSFLEIRRRMSLAEVAFTNDVDSTRPNSSHAKAWLSVLDLELDKRQILIDGCAAFQPKLKELAASGYLDVLAGVSPPPTRYAGARPTAELEHVQLNDSTSASSLGSSYHWPNCFSPDFLAYAMDTAIPNLPFMRDGMKTGKDRLSRIAADKPGVPFRLRNENPFLMLSETATAFEADLLKIGNFLNGQLHSHLLKYVAAKHGQEAVELVVPPLIPDDMVQSNINSLLVSGYSKHSDDGTLVTDNNLDYGDEDHNMWVNTFYFSNRDDAPTAVTWYENNNHRNNKSIQTFENGLHAQTSSVQFTCQHATKGPTKSTTKWSSTPKQTKTKGPQKRCAKGPATYNKDKMVKAKTTLVNVITKDDHRLAMSLRSTNRFQVKHQNVLAVTHPKITCVGDPSDYNFRLRLGQPSESNTMMGTPIRPNEPSAQRNAQSRPFFSAERLRLARKEIDEANRLELLEAARLNSGDTSVESGLFDPALDIYLDVSSPQFVGPAELYDNFPRVGQRYVKSPYCPYRFFTSGGGLRLLQNEHIMPIVYFANKEQLGPPLHFGLPLEKESNDRFAKLIPLSPGRVFPSSAVYSTLALNSSITDSQVWSLAPNQLTAAVLTKPYKNQFPDNAVTGCGPLLDYRLLKKGFDRKGFWIGGAGGASEMIGEISPDLGRPSSLEAAVLEHAQKVCSARNMAMVQATSRKAWIRIYLLVGPGGIVPFNEVDYSHPDSRRIENDAMTKVVDLGCYEIQKLSLQDVTTKCLKDSITFQKNLSITSDLKLPSTTAEFERYCRFQSEMHYRFSLTPIDWKVGEKGANWRYLHISSLDPRRIQVLIPPTTKILPALSLGADSISAAQVYEDWVTKEKLHVNFLSLRSSKPESNVENHPTVGDDLDDGESVGELSDGDGEDEQDFGLTNAPSIEQQPARNETLTSLATEQKRVITAEQVHTVIRCICIGVFCRQLQLNVDSEKRIRPLVDPGPDHDFELLNYHKHFVGAGIEYMDLMKVPDIDFLPRLGVTVQRNVFPSPIRTGDVATQYLQICNGGGDMRAKRVGVAWVIANPRDAADLLMNSIIVRTLGKTHALKSWCEYSRKRLGRKNDWFLPGVCEVPDFLRFLKQCLLKSAGKSKSRKNKLHDFTSDQFSHTLDEKFKTEIGIEQVLLTWSTSAYTLMSSGWIQKDRAIRRDFFISSLHKVFSGVGCDTTGNKLRFVCSQICADLEEMIDELPFGTIHSVCAGPGSVAGSAVFSKEEQLRFLSLFDELATDQLTMCGLEKGPGGVRVKYNKRYISLVDVEHACCKIGIFVHRLPGGGRSHSDQPRKQVPHCFPLPFQTFEQDVSSAAILQLRQIACESIAAFKLAVEQKTWVSPDNILGEKCWCRPLGYMENLSSYSEQPLS